MNEKLKVLAAVLETIPGVLRASVWLKVEGKERIYVDLTKHNGGRDWNGGVGRTLIVTKDGGVAFAMGSEWAGAATRDRHENQKTVEQIVTAAKFHLAGVQAVAS